GNDQRRQLGKAVDGGREQLEPGETAHGVEEFIAIGEGQHAGARADEHAEDADDHALAQENPEYLAAAGPQRLKHTNLARLEHNERNERARDAERCDDDDEEKDVK